MSTYPARGISPDRDSSGSARVPSPLAPEPHMKNHLQLVLTALLAVVLVALTTVVVHREFFATPEAPQLPPPELVADWEAMVPNGTWLGDSTGAIRIIEFGDLECPACRSYQGVLTSLKRRFGAAVSILFVHYPLSYHPHAYAAARAAECARQRGQFAEFVALAYAKQDSLGKKDWASFGRDAGVGDPDAFAACVADTAQVPIIESGLAMTKRFDVSATPTIFVNGWRYKGAPGEQLLVELIKTLQAGKYPTHGTVASVPVLPELRLDGGVRFMTHPAAALSRARQLTLDSTPLAIAGGAEGDPEYDLGTVSTVSLLSDHRLVALSPFESRMTVFGRDGRASGRIGRKGAGPGEFRGVPDMVRIRGDTLLVPDFGNMRLSRVTADNGVVAAASIVGRLPTSITRIVGELSLGRTIFSAAGRVPQSTSPGEKRSTAPVYLLPADSPGRVIAEIPDLEVAVVDTRYEGKPSKETLPIGFSRRAVVALWDTLLVTGSGEGYRLDLRNADGLIVAVLQVASRRRLVTHEMRLADIRRGLEVLAGYRERPRDPMESERLIRQAPYADSLPPYSRIFVTPNQTLWVVDAIAEGDSGWSATAFRLDGSIVGRLHVQTSSPPVAFGDDRVALKKEGEDGLISFEVRRITPAGSRK